MDETMTVTEVAAWLRLSRWTIYDMVKHSKIPAFRLPGRRGHLRFKRDDLERWLEEQRN